MENELLVLHAKLDTLKIQGLLSFKEEKEVITVVFNDKLRNVFLKDLNGFFKNAEALRKFKDFQFIDLKGVRNEYTLLGFFYDKKHKTVATIEVKENKLVTLSLVMHNDYLTFHTMLLDELGSKLRPHLK